jgi:pyruvate carboxylase
MLPDKNQLVRVRSSFPGEVELKVRVGDRVEHGQALVVVEGDVQIETLSARHPGTVVELCVAEGQAVDNQQLLVVLRQDPPAS